MRKIITLFLLSFLVSRFAYAQTVIPNPNEWDFGKVKQGEILKHDFIFKNETGDILNITSVHTSCGCTASQSDKKSLKPGETTVISATFDSGGYSGKVKQFIYVDTDNVALPVVKFTIKTEVIKG
jgi:hypothetical protein